MISIDRFFDIETADWDTYVLGGVVTAGSREYFSTRDPLELFYNLLDTGGDVWAWNGGLFDFLWFADIAREQGIPVDFGLAGPRIIRLTAGKLVLRDAIAVIPMSLQKASEIVGPKMSKETGLPCICDDDCGGYCSIATDMPAHLLERLDEYLKEDCLKGLDIVEAVIEEADRSSYYLGGTIGGSAYKTADNLLDLPKARWSNSAYAIAREAYFGGRTEVFQPTADEGFSYDINSAYPAALVETALPTGQRYELETAGAQAAYRNGKEGVFMARVDVPEDMYIPPLPVRIGPRVCFAVGPLQGTWTAPELREAERLGCTVQIDGGISWGESEKVLAPFMEHVWARRDANRENKALYTWHKFMANSLTGKLAERPDKERVMLFPDESDIVFCPGGSCGARCSGAATCKRSKCCDGACRGSCGRWSAVDHYGTIWSAPLWKISDCGHVHWAAYLTAATRIKLARQLRADGQGGRTALYCDTDSVYATAPRDLDIGPKLGEWGDDGPISDFFALAPKMYRYAFEGGEQVKAKGLSGITRADFDAFVSGHPVTRDRGVMSFKSAARSPNSKRLFRRKSMARSSHADGIHFGSRKLAPDGKTYPMTITELMERTQ